MVLEVEVSDSILVHDPGGCRKGVVIMVQIPVPQGLSQLDSARQAVLRTVTVFSLIHNLLTL